MSVEWNAWIRHVLHVWGLMEKKIKNARGSAVFAILASLGISKLMDWPLLDLDQGSYAFFTSWQHESKRKAI